MARKSASWTPAPGSLTPIEIKEVRARLGLTQRQLAAALGVVYATVNRWENAQNYPPDDLRDRLAQLQRQHAEFGFVPLPASPEPRAIAADTDDSIAIALDFKGDAERVSVFLEGERLAHVHQANPSFGTETSRIDPLPHQHLAVYHRMLPQARLRYLLADEQGAGKTIMAGLYIKESISRRTLRRILIVPPAGLVGSWQRELATRFDLDFRIADGPSAREDNPFKGEGSDCVIVDIDTLAEKPMWARLTEPGVEPYELAIFDEAHRLWVDQQPDGTARPTDRYQVAAAIAGVGDLPEPWILSWAAAHLLLLTARPYTGHAYPYFCLWRLLDPAMFFSEAALNALPHDARQKYCIRHVKAEMVDFAGRPIYPMRSCSTHNYALTQGDESEQALYNAVTAYINQFYGRDKVVNRSAARFAMTVFQRRLASSTWAVLCSLKKRLAKLDRIFADLPRGELDEIELIANQRRDADQAHDQLEDRTADEEKSDGIESHQENEDLALGAFAAIDLAELRIEREKVAELVALADAVYRKGEESKFEMMYGLLVSPEFAGEKVIIYTEHRDTQDFLVRKLGSRGYAGRIAYAHGGLSDEELYTQVEIFRREHGVSRPGARFFVGTDVASESLDLTFCGVMINYDVPWNPARLEQRMGRIHRYGQTKDRVRIINLVSSATREGRIVATLLERLEEIRKELGTDKVFDVIGRIFNGTPLLDYVQKAILSDDEANRQAQALDGRLTSKQVKAILAKDLSIFGAGGKIQRELPRLREEITKQAMRRVLPGYARRYLEKALPIVDMAWSGNLDEYFQLKTARPSAPMPLSLSSAIDRYPKAMQQRLTVNQPSQSQHAIFVYPGEAVFDRLSSLVQARCRSDVMHGGIFTDASAECPYLLHVARVRIERDSEAVCPSLQRPRLVEQRLIAFRQSMTNDFEPVPLEKLLELKPGGTILAASMDLRKEAPQLREAAFRHLSEKIAEDMKHKHREALFRTLTAITNHISHACDLIDIELSDVRERVSERARAWHVGALSELARIDARRTELRSRRERATAALRREPELIAARGMEIVTTILVQPSTDPEELRRQDATVDSIAVNLAMNHERLRGAKVTDVSTADKARAASLAEYPGFDLLSRYETHPIAVAVKGRADTGYIEFTENEWAKAATLRERYVLYVVFNCLTAKPRLLRIVHPFGNLVTSARGKLTISAAEITRKAAN